MNFELDIHTAYIAGLWKADNCSSAKGVVGIRSKDKILLDKFQNIMLRYFPKEKMRSRKITSGYSDTEETYVCSTELQRYLENLISNREMLSQELAYSFLAGFLDGDGSVDGKKSMLYYCYGLKDVKEAQRDKKFLEKFGYETSLLKSGKAWKVFVLKPKYFAEKIIQYVVLDRKRKELILLISKRTRGADRARSLLTVANFSEMKDALCEDCPC